MHTRSKNKLTFHIITSKTFWKSAPMVIAKIVQRNHYLSTYDEHATPPYRKLLDCDVLIDMSTITKKSFYTSLEKKYKEQRRSGNKVPLMIDPPRAIIDSFDKNRTHQIFPDLIPESYRLTGRNNKKKFDKFTGDDFVVIKPVSGWWGTGVEKLTLAEASKKYASSRGLIVQKYIPFTKGIGRIVTLTHKDDFEVVCSYIRLPNYWRTGIGIRHTCALEPVTKKLRDFALTVSKRCGLYLNGIDYIEHNNTYVLLEVNAVPTMREPYDEFAIDIPHKLLDHIERAVFKI